MRKARGPWLQGSSPHARGALVPGRLNRNGVGLIPACAGSTRSVPQSWAAWRAHPRMRGEHKLDGPLRRVHQGSSPHARGAPRSQRLDHQGSRLIPACAGSTGRGVSLTRPGTAHPRMRGEHVEGTICMRPCAGSSPHARGAPPYGKCSTGSTRLIPACAGSTTVREVLDGFHAAHPRMRGEHPCVRPWCGHPEGSSPHARGAPFVATPDKVSGGAHPRMRGEHFRFSQSVHVVPGSSPHARGAPGLSHRAGVELGLIPACAGSTSSLSGSRWCWWAHPRMRGEHSLDQLAVMVMRGSSPHARGARSCTLAPLTTIRLIPACAGSTIVTHTLVGSCGGSSPHARGALGRLGLHP